jgi:hypothetical protein
MKFDVKSLLKDKNVLRIVAIISVFNLIGYLMIRDLDSVAFFVIVGFLTTYFSKNMIIVLLASMVLTNFFALSRHSASVVEGFGKNSRKTTVDVKKAKANAKARKAKLGVQGASSELDQEEGSGRVGSLDKAATIEAAHENLESFVSPAGFDDMTKKTDELKGLMDSQSQLLNRIESMAPMMDKAVAMMDSMGGADKLTQLAESFGLGRSK